MAMRDEVIQDLEKLFKTYEQSEWFKAIIKELADKGVLNYNAMDIELLTQAIRKTLEEQCAEGVKEAIYYILRDEWLESVTSHIADYYKEFLLQREQRASHEDKQEDGCKEERKDD